MSKKSLALFLLSLRHNLAHLKFQVDDMENEIVKDQSNQDAVNLLMEYGADKIMGIACDIMETAKKIKEEVSGK